MPTALVVGGDSRIGRAVAQQLSARGWTVLATTRRPERAGPDRPFLDLAACADGVPPLPACDVCLMAAAVAGLDDCKRAPETTGRVNVAGMAAVAQAVAAQGGFVLLLSTNQVFDGSRPQRQTSEQPSPLNAYGAQKAEGEAAVLALGTNGAVLRLTKVLTPDAPVLVRWANALKDGKPAEALRDMRLAPVTLETVAQVTERIFDRRAAGIHHLSGDCDVSYADVARALADALNVSRSLVVEASYRDIGLLADMAPRHTTLDASGIRQFDMTPPRTAECLDAVLAVLAEERGV